MNSSSKPRVALIAAVANINQAIGCKGRIPWHIPDDLKYFKRMTVNHRVVMGRRTWESLGKALPDRENVVVSRTLSLPEPIVVVRSVEDALLLPNASDPVFVIGGAEIYSAALPFAHDLYLTELTETLPPEADCFFPAWDRGQFKEMSRERHKRPPGEIELFDYDFVHYVRS